MRWLSLEHGDDLLRHVLGHPLLRLSGGRAQVGRHNHSLVAEQGMGRHGLRTEHVQGGAGQTALRQGCLQRLLVYDAAARGVDQARRGLHLPQLGLPDEVARALAQRGMHRQEVRIPQ